MRTIIFVDPPAFCTAVEGLVAPALRQRPVAVAPPGADRATIVALSSEARAAGISRGMEARIARRICPDLILLPPNPHLYARASRALHAILAHWAPVIEPRWWGHAFLDLTGTSRLFGAPTDVAARIRREAHRRLGLQLSVGIASNKVVSEAATRTWRLSPALPPDLPPITVPGGDEAAFLAPHPMRLLPDIPPPIRRRLEDYQLQQIGDVAILRETDLVEVFGSSGRTLRAHAHGIDPRPVLPPAVRREFRLMHTLATDTNDLGVLHPLLYRLTDQLGQRLRRRALAGGRITVGVEFTDYASVSRHAPLPESALDRDIGRTARRLLDRLLGRRTAVRVVTVTVDHLATAGTQLDLWDAPATDRAAAPSSVLSARPAAIQDAMDRIATRWGSAAVRRGATLRHRSVV